MSREPIEVQRRRKGSRPTGRAEAPRRDTGGSQGEMPSGGSFSSGGGFPRPAGGIPTRGKQIGGCGTILILLLVVGYYLISGGLPDLSGAGGNGAAPLEPQTYNQEEPFTAAEQPVSNFTPPAPATGAGQTWTVMLYQDADDQVLEKDIFVDLNEAERVGSSERVRIVAQIDRFRGAFQGDGNWSGARRYYVTQDNDLDRINSQMVEDLGEVNMADGQTLAGFIQWAATNFPADKYVLILSDHGMGWPGGWSDPAPGGSDPSRAPLAARIGENLFLMEMDQAIRQGMQAAGINKFEMIGLDACLMSQIEVMTTLQPYARYAVASEETEPSLGWAYASFLGDLVEHPEMSGAALSKLIVESYIQGDQRIADPAARADFLQQGSPMGGLFGYGNVSAEQLVAQLEQNITISAIDLQTLPVLTQGLNDFAYFLQNDDQRLVAEARNYTQSYTSIFGRQVPASYIDLGHFAMLMANNTSDARVKQSAQDLIANLQQSVIAEKHGSGKRGSTGLAIYFPNSTLYSSPLSGPQSYTAIAKRFASETLWDDFLAFHYLDRGFESQTREPYVPAEGFLVRAPGLGNISISNITASSSTAAPEQPVTLSMEVSGENIGYVYLFVGYYDQASNSMAVVDTDYLESPDTRDVNGVYYPVWNENGFELSFKWDPIVFAVNDGQNQVPALFTPTTYGASAEEAVYKVQGTYTFVDSGQRVNASLLFQGENLVQVFGFTGSEEAGAPREITPQDGDTFTVAEKWIENQADGTSRIVYEQGGTLTFGPTPFKWETLYAAAGNYVVGFIIEDLDGNAYPVYTTIVVE